MWPTHFENLDAMCAFLVQHIAFADGSFSFMGIAPGQTLDDVRNVIGEPAEKTEDTETQQTLQFTAPIDHATHGRRDHHVLRVLFWAFNHEPIQSIRIQFDYYRWGQDSDAFAVSLRALGDALTAKLGGTSEALESSRQTPTRVRPRQTQADALRGHQRRHDSAHVNALRDVFELVAKDAAVEELF